ncbi:MAG: hypothetical protein KKD44_18075 [Proteobacteria bacterium]|nr:hypothetical protein [Pseudomonadota bacterium]
MYSLAINTRAYDIQLLINMFGKKTSRTLKKNIKKNDFVKQIKRIKKVLSTYNTERLHIPL